MKNTQKRIRSIFIRIVIYILLFSCFVPTIALAAVSKIGIEGRVYKFGEKDHYEWSSSSSFDTSSTTSTYGRFEITGDLVSKGTKSGMPVYAVNASDVQFTYSYTDALLNASDENWHLIEDKNKKVDSLTLSKNILKGAIILQSSKDGQMWLTDSEITNAFSDVPVRSEPFYSPNSIQLANGTYYRLIVVYETAQKVGKNQIAGIPTTDKYEYSKTAEVYEFYLYDSKQSINDNQNNRTLGSVVNTGNDNGYSKINDITIKDPHYGWEIGQFFVSGYTRDTEINGTPVFLKNVGDQITLWFNLKQDINKLNGSDILSINDDTNGYDQYFQTPKTDMGRGTLIIRYTDERGVKHDPEIYTNYLEANAKTSADTVVKLFEEGDYEVALDYEIKKTPRVVAGVEIIPEYSSYRIFFSFSVRNGNCMVYPFDVKTGAELTNEAITENGFKLDMAKSRYLNIDVQRAVVTEGATGYVEDVRFNRPAKDGDQYTDEGIYTFSVKNLYTGESTTKKIYVGSTGFMRALSVNKITVEELNERVGQGGIVEVNGQITMPTPTPEPTPEPTIEPSLEPSSEPTTTPTPSETTTPTGGSQSVATETDDGKSNSSPAPDNNDDTSSNQEKGRGATVPIIIGAVVVVGAGVFVVTKKKAKK